MIPEHTYKLKEISNYLGTPMNELFETFSEKVSQYVHRDLHNKKEFNPVRAIEQRERAIYVMKGYANRKHGFLGLEDLMKVIQ